MMINQSAVWLTMSSVLSSVLSLAGLVLGVSSLSHCLQSPHIAPLSLTGSGLWASATFLVSRISGRLNEENKGNRRSWLILDSVTTAFALVLSIVRLYSPGKVLFQSESNIAGFNPYQQLNCNNSLSVQWRGILPVSEIHKW